MIKARNNLINARKAINIYEKYRRIILLLILCCSIVLAVTIYNSLNITFANNEEMKKYLDSFGVLAPIVVIVVMIMELLFLPLPASVIAITNGYTFGVIEGTFYSYIAYIIVAFTAFYVSNRFGRPVIERIIKPEQLERYDHLFHKKGVYAMWFVYLFPFFPNVVASFVIGLSKISFKKFMWLPLIGYIPNLLILNYFGYLLFKFGLDLKLLILISILFIILIIFYGILHKKKD